MLPQNVLVQAQRYPRGYGGGPYNFGGFRVPLAYSTNGWVFDTGEQPWNSIEPKTYSKSCKYSVTEVSLTPSNILS